MSAFSEPKYYSEGNKLLVSFMLKVPIELEIELLGMPPTVQQQVKGQVKGQEFVSQTGNSESAVVINEDTQAELYEKIRVISDQLVVQLLESCEAVSNSPPTQHEKDIAKAEQFGIDTSLLKEEKQERKEEEKEEGTIPKVTPPTPFEKKRMARIFDSVNDGFTLGVNVVGRIFFLGKLANYSWE
ncbi:MAG: hypothetical protein ACHBN1_24135 [Heteroscytonema crispum UTEX LB 1556]